MAVMNQTQVESIVRNALQIAGTLLLAYGWTSETGWTTITGVVTMIVPIVWGVYTQTKQNQIGRVADMAEVTNVVTTPAVAAAAPSPKVIAM